MANISSNPKSISENIGHLTLEVRDEETLEEILFETFNSEEKETQETASNRLIRSETHNLMIHITDEGNHKLNIQVIEKGSWDYLLDRTFPNKGN